MVCSRGVLSFPSDPRWPPNVSPHLSTSSCFSSPSYLGFSSCLLGLLGHIQGEMYWSTSAQHFHERRERGETGLGLLGLESPAWTRSIMLRAPSPLIDQLCTLLHFQMGKRQRPRKDSRSHRHQWQGKDRPVSISVSLMSSSEPQVQSKY